ncbi:S1C family serine protease [Luteimicrobium album]|uniref:S1C family serine protease n=1 Tax=Luteimicrobium album TaxID=1054550 RepID=UPI0024E084D9|nr:trypsin-like peptidase domain-containing protein [Luteimicrobium album]
MSSDDEQAGDGEQDEPTSANTDAATPDGPAAERRSRAPWLVAGAFVAAAALGFAGGVWGGHVASSTGGACDAVHVASGTLPTIVTIAAHGSSGSGTGSGEIVRSDGVVVTNDHVITPAVKGGKIEVLLSDGRSYDAELVGRDPQTDLAVLRIDAGDSLPTIPFSHSDAVDVGEPVVALGAPLGLSGSVTAGIVSALGREVTVPTGTGGTTVLTGVVQTDASINPGNSGGALVDCDGRLVGVNTAIATVPNANGEAGGGSVGIGFAVPVDTVRAITDELLERGKVSHPSFGLAASTVTQETAAAFDVEPGLFVESVVSGGAADKAGLRPGDLVTRLGDVTAPTTATLARLTVTSQNGDKVDAVYVREGKEHQTTITLAPLPTSAR